MFNRFSTIFTSLALVIAMTSSALAAAFADRQLVRVVYERTTGTSEYVTALGDVVAIAGSPGGSGSGGTSAGTFGAVSNPANLYAVYFAIDHATSEMWVSGSMDISKAPVAVGTLGMNVYKSGSTSFFTYYNSALVTADSNGVFAGTQSYGNSYKSKLAASQGALGNAINGATRVNSEANLAGLENGSATTVKQLLYYFANGNTANSVGVPVATITNNANGSTTIGPKVVSPTVLLLSPASLGQGAVQATVTISGTGFASNAAVTFSGAGITTGTVEFVDSTTIRVPVTVAADAPQIPCNVTVTNGDGGFATKAGSFTVSASQLTPTITWPTPAAISYGTALSTTQLNAGASVSGTFAYSPGAGTVFPLVGTYELSVTFTPDSATYANATKTVNLTVDKALLSVTAAAKSKVYGDADPPLTYTATGFVNGDTLAVMSGNLIRAPGETAGTYPIDPGYLSAAANYTFAYAGATLTITKATPTITWPSAAAISFGQTLASATLSGGSASTAGSFAFTDPATSPALGTAPQGVTFTPTDSSNYNSVTGTVSVTVSKATPTITWPTAAAISYGQTLAAATLSGGSASTAGSFAFTDPTTSPALGTAPQGITFTPGDTVNYNTVSSTISVTVTKAIATVTAWPSAAAISYGQTLAGATLTGGSASTAGSFAFTTPATAPPAGTAPHGVTFTPANAINYSSTTGTVSVTVNKATLTVTADNLTKTVNTANPALTIYYSGFVNPDTAVSLTAQPTAATTAVTGSPVGSYPVNVSGGVSSNYTFNYVAGILTVTSRITPVITWPTAAAITYGQTLSSATLTGGSASTAGSFAFTTPATVPVAGTASQEIVFTPTDALTYASMTATVSVTVNQVVPTITWPIAAAISYGQTLASATLSGGSASTAGSFAFTTQTTTPAVGTATHGITFTPTDTVNYSPVTGTVNVTVTKATPTIAWPTAVAISFAQNLASATLSGGSASTAGSFAFTDPATTPAVGTAPQGVSFTPTDSSNYNSVTGAVSVTVSKATPTINWPTAAAISFGQTLASATLTGGSASTAGSFAFTVPTTAPAVGTALQGITFTPGDMANYNSVSSTVSVTVNKATPTVTSWPSAAVINYGQTLAGATLSGGSASTAGSFAFTAPAIAPAVGTAAQGVTFTPNDAVNYVSVAGTVTVTVNRANLTVTADNLTKISESPDPVLTYNATGFVNGDSIAVMTGSLTRTAGETAGTYAIDRGSLSAGSNYTIAYTAASLTISGKTVPVITWPTPVAISYGTPLSKSHLNATASVAGTFVYSPAAGSIVPAGTQTLSVTFIPDNSASYLSATATVSITINKAIPTIVWNTPAAINSGTPLSAVQLNATASVTGSLIYSPAAGSLLPAGNQPLTVTFSPTDAANYTGQTATVTQKVDSWYPSGSLTGGAAPDIDDALRVLKSSLGLDTLTAAERKHGDVAPLVNGKPAPDGRVDIGDALIILKRIVGSVAAW